MNEHDTDGIQKIFDIVETALQSAGYKILDGDDDTVMLKAPDGTEYEIHIQETG